MFPKKINSNFDQYGFPKKSKEKPKEIIGYALGKSELGMVLVATCELGILAVLRGKTKSDLIEDLKTLFPKDQAVKNAFDAKNALAEVIQFIDNPGSRLKYPVFLQGTAFQKKVWQAVQEVPFGKTATYKEIAEKIKAPRAMRAVGSSCTRSKFFMVVPCHRIVRNDYVLPSEADRKKALSRRDTLLMREIKYFQQNVATVK